MINEFRDGGSQTATLLRRHNELMREFLAECERLLDQWSDLSPADRETYRANFFGLVGDALPVHRPLFLEIRNLPSEWRSALEAML